MALPEEEKKLLKQAGKPLPDPDPPRPNPVTVPSPSPTPIPGPAGQPFIGPRQPTPLPGPDMGLRGRLRWDALLRSAPPQAGQMGTHDWDQWILSQKLDPSDPEFNAALRSAQFGAQRREKSRDAKLPGMGSDARDDERGRPRFRRDAATGGFETAREMGAEIRETKKGVRAKPPSVPFIIGPDGQPKEAALASEGETAGQSGVAAPGGDSAIEIGDVVRNGEYVYVATSGNPAGPGTRTHPSADADNYMAVEDAELLPAYWSPQQIASLQDMLGVDVNGVYDQATHSAWMKVVNTAARYAQAGRKIDLMQIAVMTTSGGRTRRGGGGGGGGRGGGGGGGGYRASEVKAFFNRVAEEELGREATADEQKAFFSALSGAGDVDPEQFAIDWIRGNKSGEAGAFSAVNFYEAMLQVLGANTQAAGG